MKLFAFLLLVASCGAVGIMLSLSLTRRRRELEAFALGVELLETEMLFAQNPLWLSFANVGKKLKGKVADVFTKIGQALATDDYSSGGQAFAAVLEAEAPTLCLTTGDWEILAALGCDLGITDIERQSHKLKAAAAALNAAAVEAAATEKKWQRIYGMGGWMLGIICGLLLI